MVATPMYGGQCTAAYHRSARELAVQMALQGFPSAFTDTVNESLITRGRNVIAETFLRSQFDALMFIDADIEFEPDDVGKLWQLGVPVACGVYTMKRDGAPYAAWVQGELVRDLERFAGPVEVDKAGTGFLMIRREAFEKLKPSVDQVLESVLGETVPVHRFFSQMVVPYEDGTAIELSEDYSFCERWTRIGGKIVMDPSVRLRHHGTKAYG
jgi:hypothetical protein